MVKPWQWRQPPSSSKARSALRWHSTWDEWDRPPGARGEDQPLAGTIGWLVNRARSAELAQAELPGMVAGTDQETAQGGTTMSLSQQHDSARNTVLGAIRAALRDVPREEQPEQVSVTRNYREKDETASRAEIIQLFVTPVEEYRAQVLQV